MKRVSLLNKMYLLLAFLFMAGVGWAQAQNEMTLVVNPNADQSETSFKTLEAAVAKANELDGDNPVIINVADGTYDLKPGTVEIQGQAGWYLPITKSNLTIRGNSKEDVIIKSETEKSNGIWSSQNLITIFGNKVTLENMTIICKKETNKVIEVVGEDVTLKNITCTPPDETNFAGSIYFNSLTDGKDIGNVSLENIALTQGRITFTGAEKGIVDMKNINIDYQNVSIPGNGMAEMAAYHPIGAVKGKKDLTINADNIEVKLSGTIESSYSLSSETVENLPINTTLILTGNSYGSDDNIQSFGTITKPGIKIQAASGLQAKPKVYGTFQLLAPGCEISRLEFYIKGGNHPVKNSIDVVAMSVIIKDNIFNMGDAALGSVGNGVNIWPYGDGEPSFVINGNTFKGFKATTSNPSSQNWSSTGLLITEEIELSRFGDPFTTSTKSKAVTLDAAVEKNLCTSNTFDNCYTNYAHSNWAGYPGGTTEENAAGGYPVRVFSYVSSNGSSLHTALNRSKDGAPVYISGELTIDKDEQRYIKKAVTLANIDPSNKATIKGCMAIQTEGVTVKDINFEYERESSLFSAKNGISVFANKATLTGNTFTSTTSDGTNGIVFYPKGSGAVTQEYTVTGNTFNLNGAASTGIIVRENFKSNSQIPGVDATASLSNGSVLDQQIIASESKNTFGNMAGGYYVRVTGNYSEKDATGSGSDAITQKYIYSYVNEGNVADAITSSQMGATVNATSVASSSLASKMNALETKTALANGIKILCSDMTVYSDLASALAATTADKVASYLKLDATTYSLVEAKKATPKIADDNKPTATEIEVGQPLSVSLLSGGSAKVGEKTIAGVFSWTDPSAKATEGSNQYDVLFTPIDQTQYTTATAEVTVKAKQYYIVTAGKCENGKVEITGANASNKYEKGTTLTVKAIPAEHYQFDKWTEGTDSYKVTKDASLVATFKAITHKVTFGEGITVLNAGTAITTGADVAEGSVLTVTASKDGNKLTSLTSNKKNIINNQVVVDGALNIEATFEALPASTRLVKVDYSDANTQNGKVQLFDEDGNIIESGSAVAVGNTVSVVAVPDYGYKVGELTVTGATHQNNQFKVEANDAAIVVKQVFEKRTFAVTLPTEGTDHAKVAIEGSSNLDAVPFDSELTIKSATASDGYKLISIIVNGKEAAVGDKFKVTADIKVNAVVEKLPEIQFTDIEQTCTYNGNVQAFVVRTIPAGISGITLSYKENNQNVTDPKNVGTYDVYASYVGTDYAGIDKKIGTLTIEKAEWTGVAIPEATDVKEGTDVNQYHWGSTVGNNFQEAYYKLPPELSNNYNDPKFIIPQVGKAIDKITLMQETPQKRSIVLKSTSSMTFNGKYGSIEIYNGPVKVGENAYEGQTLTLKAIPEAGYSSIPKWKSEGTTVTDNLDGTATVIIVKDAKVTAEFAEKQEASITTGKTALRTYNGVAYGSGNAAINLPALIDSKVKGWSLAIRQNGLSVDQPINAGTYDIVASRQEDEAYAATSTTIGTLSIAKATPVLTDVKGSDIIAGQTLRESVLSGTSNVQGTFSWKNPDTQMNTVNASQKAIAIFKSDDSNYTNKEVEATLNVTAKSEGITTRTLTLTVNNPENGKPVVTTLNGTPFTGSISVKKDDVLKVTFEANNNCTASATINGTTYTSGSTYTIGETDNVEVVVTFTKNSTPDTDPDEPSSQPIAVTGVSLDTTDKTLAVNETLILGATVKPSNADNKDVRWSSSDATVASVDQDGKVKALKAGTCTITVTTDDGNFTATCKITVTTATGIDDILAVNRVYSQNGQIVIEPMYQPEVWITDLTGRIMYHNRIAEKTQVAASAGIYLVRLSESGKAKTIKVIVK